LLRLSKLLILLSLFFSLPVLTSDYIKDAREGLPKSQYRYAMELIEAGNETDALNWLTISATQGYLKSSDWIKQNLNYQEDIFLNALIDTNDGLRDLIRTYTPLELKELKKQGKQGDSKSQFILWLLYVNDLYIKKPRAYVWLKKTAERKYPRALFGLGLLYFYGYIVPQQETKAFDLIENSRNLGYSFALFFLERFGPEK